MNNQFILILVVLCILTHIIRTVYEIIKHKKVIKPNQLSFTIIFTNMFLLWSSWFTLSSMDRKIIYLPPVINFIGIILAVVGLFIFLIALFTIKSLETYEGSLITFGIYSRIRHPMYLGFILWIIGMPLFHGSVYSIILSLPFAINVLFWRHLEEIELLHRYPDYIAYKKKTIF